MPDLVGSIFLVVGMIGVALIATVGANSVRERLRKYPIKKIGWGLVVVAASYWYVTTPWIGRPYDFANSPRYDQEISAETVEGKYITDHQKRIERLEDELESTQTDLRALQDHYNNLVRLGWYGIIIFGCLLILRNDQRPKPGPQSELNLND